MQNKYPASSFQFSAHNPRTGCKLRQATAEEVAAFFAGQKHSHFDPTYPVLFDKPVIVGEVSIWSDWNDEILEERRRNYVPQPYMD